ncbi:MAG: GIY-YIG nuclease family protein [Patescibacteria group bacterium]
MFYLYILQSIKFGTYYIGTTKNLVNRLSLHNKGKAVSTKNKRPWKIIFSKKFSTLSDARKMEIKLKSFKKRTAIEGLIKHF